MPAFAATATATAATNSAMTKLLKNVFCAGCAAVMTVTIVHPVDVVKTRVQVASNKGDNASVRYTISSTVKNEGTGAFYKGIQPAWCREASYSSLRLGLYEPIKVLVGANNANAGFLRKFIAGSLAGAIGSMAGNPFDVLKTRMMANRDEDKPMSFYAGEIYKLNGILGFWKGFNTNVVRAMVNNATQMACYDVIKVWMMNTFLLEGILLQFLASLAAGFFITLTVSPFDKSRTLLMNQSEDSEVQLKGLPDCLMHILKTEGFTGLYKGCIPAWTRIAPTTVF